MIPKEKFKFNLIQTKKLCDHFSENEVDYDQAMEIISVYLAARWFENEDFLDDLCTLPEMVSNAKKIIAAVHKENNV